MILKILLLILLIASPAFAQDKMARMNVAIMGGGGNICSGYLVCQGFEGTGYDNSESWTESVPSGGTVNEDYTTVVLDGIQSLYVAAGITVPAYTYTDLAADISHVYGYQMFRYSASLNDIVMLNSSGGTALGRIRIDANKLVCYDGGSTVTNTGATTLTVDTTYHLWWEYQKGTGANSIMRAQISTTGTKPGTNECEITTGADTLDFRRFVIFLNEASVNLIVDKIRVDNTAIGSNPQ